MYISTIQLGGFVGIVCVITYFVVRAVQKNKVLEKKLQSAIFLNSTLQNTVAQLDEQKTEFISIASHQLRTPLAIIRGYMELLESGAYSENIEEALKDINIANERLIELVEALLHVAEIDQGKLFLQFEKTNIIEIIQSVYNELLPVAEKKNITLMWNADISHIELVIDAEKIRMVIYNLLENAIKYSDEGDVHIDIYHASEYTRISIQDQGRGFSEEESEYMFQKFYRSAGARSMDVSGSGLGLYIAKQIIKEHKAEIYAESPGIGKGARFSIHFPICREDNVVYDMYSA